MFFLPRHKTFYVQHLYQPHESSAASRPPNAHPPGGTPHVRRGGVNRLPTPRSVNTPTSCSPRPQHDKHRTPSSTIMIAARATVTSHNRPHGSPGIMEFAMLGGRPRPLPTPRKLLDGRNTHAAAQVHSPVVLLLPAVVWTTPGPSAARAPRRTRARPSRRGRSPR